MYQDENQNDNKLEKENWTDWNQTETGSSGYYQNGYGQMPGEEDPEEKKKRKRKKWGLIAAVAVCFLLLVGGGAWAVNKGVDMIRHVVRTELGEPDGGEEESQEPEEQLPAKQLETTAVLENAGADTQIVATVVENTMPSVVSITSTVTTTYNDFFGRQYSQDGQGSGSGIIIGQTDSSLLILTNHHVISGAKTIQVTFIDDKTAEASVKGSDSSSDLAVLTIPLDQIGVDTMSAIKIAKLGDSDELKVGEMAIAIGNALGYGQSVTVGYISAKDRKVESDGGTSLALVQTDAAINPGNSGGALLNLKGEVIGINSVKYADKDVEGMGFAIPISTATPIIEDLKEREELPEEEKGYIGIVAKDVTEDMVQGYNMPKGVFVYSVSEGGPAEKAGILTGDIITKINDIEVSTMDGLKERVNSYRAGTEITVTYMRNINGTYQENTVSLTLTKSSEVE